MEVVPDPRKCYTPWKGYLRDTVEFIARPRNRIIALSRVVNNISLSHIWSSGVGWQEVSQDIVLHCHDDDGGFVLLINKGTSLFKTQIERDLPLHWVVAWIYRLWDLKGPCRRKIFGLAKSQAYVSPQDLWSPGRGLVPRKSVHCGAL